MSARKLPALILPWTLHWYFLLILIICIFFARFHVHVNGNTFIIRNLSSILGYVFFITQFNSNSQRLYFLYFVLLYFFQLFIDFFKRFWKSLMLNNQMWEKNFIFYKHNNIDNIKTKFHEFFKQQSKSSFPPYRLLDGWLFRNTEWHTSKCWYLDRDLLPFLPTQQYLLITWQILHPASYCSLLSCPTFQSRVSCLVNCLNDHCWFLKTLLVIILHTLETDFSWSFYHCSLTNYKSFLRIYRLRIGSHISQSWQSSTYLFAGVGSPFRHQLMSALSFIYIVGWHFASFLLLICFIYKSFSDSLLLLPFRSKIIEPYISFTSHNLLPLQRMNNLALLTQSGYFLRGNLHE